MRILVTGSSGHLGEALVRTLKDAGHEVIGLDVQGSRFTSHVASLCDREAVRHRMAGVWTVFHTAALHKPHIAAHSRQDFVDTNITGTLNLLEEAVSAGVRSFIYTSTTSVFGDALVPPRGAPAAWITEDVAPAPKNIYGVTKAAAEDLCQLFHRNQGLPCIVLRTARFFPEADDNKGAREAFADENLKANEFLYRRVEIEDIVSAHLLAAERASATSFRKYIISATTPFRPNDMAVLRSDAPGLVARYVPHYEHEYRRRGWKMLPSIDRVYVNDRARAELGWQPQYDFDTVIRRLAADEDTRSSLARAIGSKGYQTPGVAEGPYPVE